MSRWLQAEHCRACFPSQKLELPPKAACQRPASVGSISLHPQSTLGRVLPARPPRHAMLLLLEGTGLPDWRESPVGQGQSAEDEERAAPPQDLLALSVQHEPQEGRAEDI